MPEQMGMFPQPSRPRLPPPRERDVLFFALLLGPQLKPHLEPLTGWLWTRFGVGSEPHAIDRLHVSVMGAGFLDDMTEDDVAAVTATGPTIDFAPFDLSFTEIMSFGGRGEGGRRPLVLVPRAGGDLVIDLADRLTDRMIAQSFDPRAFKPKLPHLTLLYDTAKVPAISLERPIRVRVDGFALIHSHRGQSRYSVLWETGREG